MLKFLRWLFQVRSSSTRFEQDKKLSAMQKMQLTDEGMDITQAYSISSNDESSSKSYDYRPDDNTQDNCSPSFDASPSCSVDTSPSVDSSSY